ncbi:uncharacterized protein PAC_09156 [Phialocephala subalpina]|uniref:Uncharacterized protein n=1 Tax=Phialocephala subalpina TaxID=576137 RepID=A0A1L7X2L7_9HELO|nr:uncharacterized protein PAC_09156 [Phialocephala subalpina]
MQNPAPEVPNTPDITDASLKDSIKTSNRLSQVMGSQIQSQGVMSHGAITPPISRGPSYNDKEYGAKPFTPTTAEAILSEPDRTGYVVPTSLIPEEKCKGKGKEVVAESSTSASASMAAELTITPGTSDFEKSVMAKAMKEKAESEGFWKRFEAAQSDPEKLSVNHPWYIELVGSYRAEVTAKAAKQKEEDAREAALREAHGPVKEKKRERLRRWAEKPLKKIGVK